jgi:hypothetical protein
MAMLRTVAAIAIALVLNAGCAAAGDNPFLGEWKVSDAQPGPWVGPNVRVGVNPKIMNATITFGAASVTGPEPLGCAKARYEVKTVGPEFLFEGGLTDPKAQAHALGFTTDTFTAMSFSCDRPDADVSMDYAMADKNTALFALDNIIYTMKRNPPQ